MIIDNSVVGVLIAVALMILYVKNVVAREFDDSDILEVIVSDLTYVRVNGKWNYICLFTDLYNREILRYTPV